MLYMGLAHLCKTMVLDQFNDPAKARLHVDRQRFDLISNAGVEDFNDPRHTARSYYCIFAILLPEPRIDQN